MQSPLTLPICCFATACKPGTFPVQADAARLWPAVSGQHISASRPCESAEEAGQIKSLPGAKQLLERVPHLRLAKQLFVDSNKHLQLTT